MKESTIHPQDNGSLKECTESSKVASGDEGTCEAPMVVGIDTVQDHGYVWPEFGEEVECT